MEKTALGLDSGEKRDQYRNRFYKIPFDENM